MLSGLLTSVPAPAQSGRPVVTPDDASAPAGQSVSVAVRTSAALTLGSSDLTLTFDPTIVEVTAADSPLEGFTFHVRDADGTLTTASASGGAGQSIAAGEALLHITLRIRSDATVGCTEIALADGDGTLPNDLGGPVPPIPPSRVLYDIRPGTLCVLGCRSCDDHDHCTEDACDRTASRCQHTEKAATEPAGVTCSL